MVRNFEKETRGKEFPFNLEDGYSLVVLESGSKKVGRVSVKETRNENKHTAFILDMVEEVGRLPRKSQRAFGKKLALVGAFVLPFSASSVLGSQKASAAGLDQLIPYLEQRNSLPSNYQYENQPQLPVNGQSQEMIPVDGNLAEQITQMGILPLEMVDLLINIITACGILGVLLAMICLMVAGGFRMMGQLERAKKWSVDVVKGLGQILLAPVIILILSLITTSSLNGIEGLDLFY